MFQQQARKEEELPLFFSLYNTSKMEKGTHSMASDLWQSKVKRLRTLNFLLHGTVLFGVKRKRNY